MVSHPIADGYFAAVHARDPDALAALFTEDGVMTLPDGRDVTGAAAIRAMYAHVFAASAPSPKPLAIIAGPAGVAVEIEASFADGLVLRTANFFHFNDAGRVHHLSVYKRA